MIWACTNPDHISTEAREIIKNPENQIYVSCASFWEMSIKSNIAKLDLGGLKVEDFYHTCQKTGFDFLDIDSETSSTSYQLKATHHKDPFERILIWQCLKYKFTLISKDDDIVKYSSEGLQTIW